MNKSFLYTVRVRFLASIVGNLGRGALNFLTMMLVARFLLPHDYGKLCFLLTGVLAFIQLFDQGVASAFYTFITRNSPRAMDYVVYVLWLLFQLILVMGFFIFFGSTSWFSVLWNHAPKHLVELVFFVLFFRQLIWSSVIRYAEAKRQTVLIQGVTVFCSSLYLFSIIVFHYYFGLTVQSFCWITVGMYVFFSTVTLAYLVPWEDFFIGLNSLNFLEARASLSEYFSYSRPLVFMAIVTFFYTFLETWMLSHFAGASQQGYFQVAFQFVGIALLSATALMNIFGKELSVLYSSNASSEKLYELFRKVFRVVFLLSAMTAGFLIAWAKVIILIFLGAAYLPSEKILVIIFINVIYVAIGQVLSMVYLMTLRTRIYAWINIVPMIVSVPVTYLILAPTHHAGVPGLNLQAFGFALKLLVLGWFTANSMHFILCYLNKWPYDWSVQFITIGFFLILGFGVHALVLSIATFFLGGSWASHLSAFLLAAALYGILSLCAVLLWTSVLVGMDRRSLLGLFRLNVK